MSDARQEELRRRLGALGFDEVRFASVDKDGAMAGEGLRAWLEAGRHGDMAWMERTAEKRLDPRRVLAGAQSMILLGVNYWAGETGKGGAVPSPRAGGSKLEGAAPSAPPDVDGGDGAPPSTAEDEAHGARGAAFVEVSADAEGAAPPGRERTSGEPTWARYALYEDYHDTMKPALVAAGRVLEELYGVGGEDYRYYVDTGPVLERSWAARAGIGFVGKNAMLISRRHGNWLLLAAIMTRVALAADAPVRKTVTRPAADGEPGVGLLCGKCTRCLDACPTQAFAAPGVVDARRCVSYQTIENKGIIPRELRAGIGARIYGCDVCLEVCPWNRFAQAGRAVLLVARRELAGLALAELLALTPERFAAVFRRTPIKRVKLAGLLRNACVVAGNSGDERVLPAVVRLAGHALPLVRAHAVWAVFRLAGERAAGLLTDARAAEMDAGVLEEYAAEENRAG